MAQEPIEKKETQNTESKPASSPQGQGSRPQGQSSRPQGQSSRPQGQGGSRPQGQGYRPQGQGYRPQGRGGGSRPQGRFGGGGRPQGGRPQGNRPFNRRGGRFQTRRKVCAYCADKEKTINWKKPETVRRYVGDAGQIFPRRKSGVCARHQRRVAIAIKRARHMALLPYTSEHVRVMRRG